MNIEYTMAYLRIIEEMFDPDMEVFIPDTGLSYMFEKNKPKDINEAGGEWISIHSFGEQGWELYHIIPKNLLMVGMFKRIEYSDNVITNQYDCYHTFSESIVSTIQINEYSPKHSFIEFEYITVNKLKRIVESNTKPVNDSLLPLYDDMTPPFCAWCGSSIKRKWFRPTGKCIHPSCPNYWNKKIKGMRTHGIKTNN